MNQRIGRVDLINIDSWTLKCLVFKFTFCFLKWVSFRNFKFIITELTPWISSPISSFCFKCIISSVFRNKTNFNIVDSWKELFRSVINIIIITSCKIILNVLILNLIGSLIFNWFFSGLNLTFNNFDKLFFFLFNFFYFFRLFWF